MSKLGLTSMLWNTFPWPTHDKLFNGKSRERRLTFHWTSFVSAEPVDGAWTAWSSWSSISAPCRNGTKYRTRSCSDPPPQDGGKMCEGDWNSSAPRRWLPVSPTPLTTTPHYSGTTAVRHANARKYFPTHCKNVCYFASNRIVNYLNETAHRGQLIVTRKAYYLWFDIFFFW